MGDRGGPQWLTQLTGAFGAPFDLLRAVSDYESPPPNSQRAAALATSGLWLWRGALRQGSQFDAWVRAMRTELPAAFRDIPGNYNGSQAVINVGNLYESFQGVSFKGCECKYNYASTARHPLFKRHPVISTWMSSVLMQPTSVTACLNTVFGLAEAISPHAANPFAIVILNQHRTRERPNSHIPWHDDAMELAAQTPEDAKEAVVLSFSVGDTAVFCYSPNSNRNKEFWGEMGGYGNWTNAKQRVRGRVAFCVHDGDILLMTGESQNYFSHKTWPTSRLNNPTQEAINRNYKFLRFPDDPERTCTACGLRYNITLRMIKYHLQQCMFKAMRMQAATQPQPVPLTRPTTLQFHDVTMGGVRVPTPCHTPSPERIMVLQAVVPQPPPPPPPPLMTQPPQPPQPRWSSATPFVPPPLPLPAPLMPNVGLLKFLPVPLARQPQPVTPTPTPITPESSSSMSIGGGGGAARRRAESVDPGFWCCGGRGGGAHAGERPGGGGPGAGR